MDGNHSIHTAWYRVVSGHMPYMEFESCSSLSDQVKMRSSWMRVGLNLMTGVLIRERREGGFGCRRHTETHTEDRQSGGDRRQRLEWFPRLASPYSHRSPIP